MRAMRRWVAVTAVVVVAGCGTPTGDGSTTTDGPTTSASTTSEVTTSTVSPWADDACRIERATMETANEAHKVSYGAYAESLELIGEWLAHPPKFDWTYTSDGESFTLTGPC